MVWRKHLYASRIESNAMSGRRANRIRGQRVADDERCRTLGGYPPCTVKG